jgi:hypothetical protein
MFILKEFIKGIVLRGENSDVSDNIEGALFHNKTDKKIRTFIDSAVREILTSNQAQTITNKTIDYNQNTFLNLPGGGGSAIAFSNIVVAGQGTVTATAASDSLNLIAGLNVTLVTDPVTKSVTINSIADSGSGAVSSVNGQTGAVTLTKTDVGLSNVDNTSDANKPISTATSTALSNKANINLSNLSSPVAIPSGVDLISEVTGITTFFRTKSKNVTTGDSGSTVLTTGDSSVGASGSCFLETGFASTASGQFQFLTGKSATGLSGQAVLSTGAIDTTSASIDNSSNTNSTGLISIFSGRIRNTANTNRTGAVSIATGSSDTTLGSGNLTINSGTVVSGAGSSGFMLINSGTNQGTGASGTLQFQSGSCTNAASSANTGSVFVFSGNNSGSGLSGGVFLRSGTSVNGASGQVDLNSGAPSGSGVSGNVRVFSGNTTSGNSGTVLVASGASTTGNSGDINITTGTGVQRGNLILSAKEISLNATTLYAENNAALVVSTLQTNVTTDIDLLKSGTVYHKILTASTTFQFLNIVSGKRFTVVVKNTTAGALTVNFPTTIQKAGMLQNTVNANSANIYEFVASDGEYYLISCITDMV